MEALLCLFDLRLRFFVFIEVGCLLSLSIGWLGQVVFLKEAGREVSLCPFWSHSVSSDVS